jgi:hypothetical protein
MSEREQITRVERPGGKPRKKWEEELRVYRTVYQETTIRFPQPT